MDLRGEKEGNIGWMECEKAFITHIPESRWQASNAMYCGTLFGLAAALQPRVTVEIGTQYGMSTRMWLAATKTGRVLSIDPDPACFTRLIDDIRKHDWTDRWVFKHARSQDVTPIECDLLYVDGDHSYPAVCSDMARHGTKVRDGGLVVLDDYHHTWPGKMRWVDERIEVLDPLFIGPTVVVRVTPAKREAFAKEFP